MVAVMGWDGLEGQKSPASFFISICFHLGLNKYSPPTMCTVHLEGQCVEVGLYPGRVHPVGQGPLLELLPGVGGPGEQGEGRL